MKEIVFESEYLLIVTEIDVQPMDAVLVGDPDPELVALEARLRAAQLNADVAELERLIAAPALHRAVRGTYRYTRIWAREDGGAWRVVGGHVSAVP
jgi:ketosteroid isomerase-like protein